MLVVALESLDYRPINLDKDTDVTPSGCGVGITSRNLQVHVIRHRRGMS